ncbi:MAG: hypothetical protein M5U25_05930 [Planctomycetota bacterium]|nr:hypothetical protein [Planctomycetota bacterium]
MMKVNHAGMMLAVLVVASVVSTLLSAQTFSNAGAITIPSSSAATPYPSTINVTGLTGTPASITVTLTGVSHTWPDDIDILLENPNGDAIMLMSDCGWGTTSRA